TLRFDDATFVRSRIELAIVHRDKAAAYRWVDRLLAMNPDASSALSIAARVYVAFGELPRAVAAHKRSLELAPEDTGASRALAALYATDGRVEEQRAMLRRVLELLPQSTDVREYLASLEPERSRQDEAYAVAEAEFLKDRARPADGFAQRTLVNLQVT